MSSYGDIISTHALATVVIPAILTFALVCWCAEFYRPEPLRKRPLYLALIVATTTCVALTVAMFVTEL
jgi:hypothetical protein